MQSRFGGNAPSGPASLEGPKQPENVYTTVVAKASNLPPSIDTRRVEELFADFPSLKITRVEKIPPQGPSPKGRPSATMKVIFDKDASARDLDDAMNKLNDKKYLGKGYYLHLDRYLGGRSVETAQRTEAFGARWQAPELPKGFAPPPVDNNRLAHLCGPMDENLRQISAGEVEVAETGRARILNSSSSPQTSLPMSLHSNWCIRP